MGISRAHVFINSKGSEQSPLVTQRKKQKWRNVRRNFHGFYFKNEWPMLSSVLAVMNSDPDQLCFKTMILHINLNACFT
jgi:hypothetical protein